MDIFLSIKDLIQYALNNDLLSLWDVIPAFNKLTDTLGASPTEEVDLDMIPGGDCPPLFEIMADIFDYGIASGFIEDTITAKDLLDSKIMGELMPRASEVVDKFYRCYGESPESATDYFFHLCINSNYIQSERIKRNIYWIYQSQYGPMEITINLSKPEKDPAEIAKMKDMPKSGYPACLLCKENAGFAGNYNHPARQNLRLIPVELQGETWFFQYSPYSYYNEHSIILSPEHGPMKINNQTFRRLVEFLGRFPHYTIGSNADLPIVGGSILNHDHYQAGRHVFPMDNARTVREFQWDKYPGMKGSILYWPLSVLRLESHNPEDIAAASQEILTHWRGYSNEGLGIRSHTGETPHNTITPILRKNKAGNMEMDLALRNNRTTEEAPLGLFHPHEKRHHIKKENIGLIEVLGLAILPGRLDRELVEIQEILEGKKRYAQGALLNKDHEEWVEGLMETHGVHNHNGWDIVKNEVGKVFEQVLEDCGVFKQDEEGIAGFASFLEAVGLYEAGGKNNG